MPEIERKHAVTAVGAQKKDWIKEGGWFILSGIKLGPEA
jgi:hypothetical protein